MQAAKSSKGTSQNAARCGLFSKKEAASWIAEGIRHIHSSNLGERDPAARLTMELASNDTASIPTYPWEHRSGALVRRIQTSRDRHAVIQKLLEDPMAGQLRRELQEKSSHVIEELITNSIYHGYRNPDGSNRYPRKQSVELQEFESLQLTFNCNSNGVFISMRDAGGTFPFSEIVASFQRCYRSGGPKVESKEQGAGLGLYLIFEEVSHLKIVSIAKSYTEVSCWIADQRSLEPRVFSFNFFDRR